MKRLYIIFGSIALLLLMQTLMSMGSLAKPIEIASLDGISQSLDGELGSTVSGAFDGLKRFYSFTGFANATSGNLVMILIGIIFIYLGIKYDYEPLLLIPIGAGVIIGNVPFVPGNQTGIYESGSVLNYLYFGVVKGIYPPLIFLGIGAMTDFSSLIANPKLMLLGAAAQIGVFATFIGALYLGFNLPEAGAIGIIGGADGPTAIFLSSKLANGINILADGTTVKNLIGPIAIAAYSYMALVPVIQPPLMRLLISKEDRKIRMKPPRAVSQKEQMITILLGVTVGASTQADIFITKDSLLIFGLGAISFVIATMGGLLFAKFMNRFLKGDNKINPLIGAAGVSAVPDSARVVHAEALKSDPHNYLLMHAMAPNVSGVIGSAIAAGIILSFLS